LVNYDHIDLTPEEEAIAIHKAKSIKAAKLKEIEYSNKLTQPKVYAKFSYDQLKKFVIERNFIVHQDNEKLLEQYKSAKQKHYILDDHNEAIFEILCMYFSGDPAFELQGDDYSLDKGLMFYGPIGCGKTSLMKMFAINSFRPFAIASCKSIANTYAAEGIPALERFASLQPVFPHQNFGIAEIGRCFDDLGTEDDKKNFGNQVNVMQDILTEIYNDELYSNFFLTTNLTGDQIDAQYGPRIRSRMREMFNLVIFDEQSPDRRK